MRWKWQPLDERSLAWLAAAKQWHPYRPIWHTVYAHDAKVRVWGETVFRRWKNKDTYVHEIPHKPWSLRTRWKLRNHKNWEYCSFPLDVGQQKAKVP